MRPQNSATLGLWLILSLVPHCETQQSLCSIGKMNSQHPSSPTVGYRTGRCWKSFPMIKMFSQLGRRLSKDSPSGSDDTWTIWPEAACHKCNRPKRCSSPRKQLSVHQTKLCRLMGVETVVLEIESDLTQFKSEVKQHWILSNSLHWLAHVFRRFSQTATGNNFCLCGEAAAPVSTQKPFTIDMASFKHTDIDFGHFW
jgi:hypothetical protein